MRQQELCPQQTTPLINKTNELDDLTAKNSKDIKDVDARAQAGIQPVNAKSRRSRPEGAGCRSAGRSGSDPGRTTPFIAWTCCRTRSPTSTTISVVTETSVQFGFNKDNLTKKAKEALDQLADDVANTKGYIIDRRRRNGFGGSTPTTTTI